MLGSGMAVDAERIDVTKRTVRIGWVDAIVMEESVRVMVASPLGFARQFGSVAV